MSESLRTSGRGTANELESLAKLHISDRDHIEWTRLTDVLNAWIELCPKLKRKGNALIQAIHAFSKSNGVEDWATVRAAAATLAPMFKQERLLTKSVLL